VLPFTESKLPHKPSPAGEKQIGHAAFDSHPTEDMSKARAIIEDKQPSEGMKWYNWALSSSQHLTSYATVGAQFVRQNAFSREYNNRLTPLTFS
jgi:hypothetical protein